jgi:hypothetical protein
MRREAVLRTINRGGVMRKRRISYVAALGLALAVAIPGTAMATGTQSVQAGFLPEFNANIPQPPPTSNTGGENSKAGTLYTRLFLANIPPGSRPSSAGVFDIHAPEELTFNTKGLAQCDPAQIQGQSTELAEDICSKSLIGSGSASAALGSTGAVITGGTSLFNGTPQNGSPTVLFHSTAGTPVTLVSEMQQSPLPGYGVLFHTLVAQGAGGGVPDGTPIIDTDFTISKKYTDKKILKKAKKAKKQGNIKKYRKLKKKSKKSWVVGKCTDGTLETQINVSYIAGGGPPQQANASQSCN